MPSPSSLVLMALLSATAALGQSGSLTINSQCFTMYGTQKPRSVHTDNYDSSTTQTNTQVVGFTPRATVTPAAITSSVTTTSTSTSIVTASTTTDTYTTSSTTTIVIPTVLVQRYTQTATSTTTITISSTTIISTAPGFTPLASMSNYQAKKRTAIPRRGLEARTLSLLEIPPLPSAEAKPAAHVRARQAATTTRATSSTSTSTVRVATTTRASSSSTSTSLSTSSDTSPASQFAQSVICTRSLTYVQTVTSTSTAATSTTTLPVVTQWTTSTVQAVQVNTVTPAEVTQIITIPVSQTTTSTSTSSTTSTTTSTVTNFLPSATYLAQCAPANQVSEAYGLTIGGLLYNPAFTLVSTKVTDLTGYDCCAACAADPLCAGYAQAPMSFNGYCYYLRTDGRCDATQSFSDAYKYYNVQGTGYIVGNGQCGFLGPHLGST